MSDALPANTFPAATVVLLRDGEQGLESLMLRRNSKLEFAGGMWVFPGGRVDPDRLPRRRARRRPRRARVRGSAAAAREALRRPTSSSIPSTLVWFSHWTPPAIAPKRFAHLLLRRAGAGGRRSQIDGGEIHGHAWMTPADAMRRRNALEIELSPPTWITLEQLAAVRTTAEALAGRSASQPPEWFATRIAGVDGGVVALYHGDAGYDDEDADRPGPRHRLWMLDSGWRYERTDGY